MMLVCVKCGKFLHPKKNGVVVEEGMPNGEKNLNANGWGSYKLWMADLLECRECGVEIISGFGFHPFAEHYQDDYNAMREKYPPRVFVEDCI